MSLNYKFSISNGSASRLFSHTGGIIHAFAHGGLWIWICIDAMLGYVAAFVRVRILRSLIHYCFNQEQRRTDAGLLDHLLRPRTVRNNVLHPFHAVAFLDYPYLIRNLYLVILNITHPTLMYHIQPLSITSTTSLPYTIQPHPARTLQTTRSRTAFQNHSTLTLTTNVYSN